MTELSVQTLHYYEEMGLLVPADRTDTGHRLYTEADIVRLQQILSLKNIGFSLEETLRRRYMEVPGYTAQFGMSRELLEYVRKAME